MKKKFNYANLPVLSIPIICILSFIGFIIFDDEYFELTLIACTFLTIMWIAGIFCPIGLIFQIRNKNKTILDKVLLVINVLMSILGIVLIISIFAK